MARQSASAVLMVEPAGFYCNPETIVDNNFQRTYSLFSKEELQAEALQEFNDYRGALERYGVDVRVFRDVKDNGTPDSIFPNNWFSTHEDSLAIVYPMKAPTRRKERRADIIAFLSNRYRQIFDLSDYENHGKFLEGTGSLVLDRVNKIAYAALSQRTDAGLVDLWCEKLGFQAVKFTSHDHTGGQVYHTNVMMSVGTGFAVVCFDSIRSEVEKGELRERLKKSGREIIEVSMDQVNDYCANILEVQGREGPLICISRHATDHFSDAQLKALENHGRPVFSDLSTIELIGGGGARCMLAELF